MEQLRKRINDCASRIHPALGKPVSKQGLQKIVAGAMLIPASVGVYGCSNSIEGKLQENSSVSSSQNQIKGYPIKEINRYHDLIAIDTEVIPTEGKYSHMCLTEYSTPYQWNNNPGDNIGKLLEIYTAEIINPEGETQENLTITNNELSKEPHYVIKDFHSNLPAKVHRRKTLIYATSSGTVLQIDSKETTPYKVTRFNDLIKKGDSLWPQIRNQVQQTFNQHYSAIKEGSKQKEQKLAREILESHGIK